MGVHCLKCICLSYCDPIFSEERNRDRSRRRLPVRSNEMTKTIPAVTFALSTACLVENKKCMAGVNS